MRNQEVAEVFENIADLLSIKGEAIYKVLAYRKAGEELRALGRDVNAVFEEGGLEDIPGIGKAIAGKVQELLETGQLGFYEKLVEEVPLGLVEVLRVPDVGPKKAKRFWKELGITSVEQLEVAAKGGELRALSGMGAKSETKILEGIQAMRVRESDRVLLGRALPIAQSLLDRLDRIEGVGAAEFAGSLRRMKETIGDIDLVVAAEDSGRVMEAFLSFPEIQRIRGTGETKSSVELFDGMQVQLWVYPPHEFGAALQYATGSQAHNVRLRELALSEGLSLSDHGFKRPSGEMIHCSDEMEVYATLGMAWVPPELREDRGEVEAALDGRLPDLIQLSDIKGELHAHSNWSDGRNTIMEMASAARESGLRYLAITDHSRSLGIANGLSINRLRKQRKAIDDAQENLGRRFHLLHGAEVEILADGSLDYPDEVLQELDIVIASLHSTLRQPREKVTTRLMKAIENPQVDIIGHPTGRLIGSRAGADLDMDRVLAAAAEHGVALEINANPERLDLNDVHARRAAEMGIPLMIGTDAHGPDQLEFRSYGVGVARRAWVAPSNVINTWTYAQVMKWLASHRSV